MTDIVGCFPVSASMVSLAHEAFGDGHTKVIGVTIQILVETDHVKELPQPWRKLAEAQLYKAAVESDR
jgi:hypothetical protein